MALFSRRKNRNSQSGSASSATLELLQPVSRKQRLLRISLLASIVILFCWLLDSVELFRVLESYATELRMSLYDRKSGAYEKWAREHITILELSDESFNPENPLKLPAEGTPVPRSLHAKVIRELNAAGAKVIAFDFLFSKPRPPDKEFAAAAKQYGNVLWACQFREGQNSSNNFVGPVPALLEASPHLGHIYAPKDEEHGTVTHIPVVRMHDGKPIPAFSVVAAQMYLGLSKSPLEKIGNEWNCGPLFIPTDENNQLTIKYLGKEAGEVFASWPYERAYDGFLKWDFYKKHQNEPTVSLRNKIVLIGDTTTLGHDVALTPLKEMAGIEIHAHAIATVLRNSFVFKTPASVNFVVLCVLTLIVSLIAANCRATWAVLASTILLVGFWFFDLWLFFERDIVLSLVAPSAAICLTTLAVVTERTLTVERVANHTRALLQRYVSPQIANYILAHPEKAALGGTRVTATVLFSDIRGFTAMSEKLTPEEVLARLNEYLQEMTDVVFEHDGAVDKYIGDAVMALFGVPLVSDNHAQKAVATAIGMQDALLQLQERWRAEGLPLIDIGIGINTGELVFGNIGASQHFDFSVLGDTVNLASRVESLNKDMHSRILVTATTYEIVREQVRARGPLITHVKGKEEEVVVYEIFGWQEDGIGENSQSSKFADALANDSTSQVEKVA